MSELQTPQTYLDPQTLSAVGSLELRARLIVEGLMIGMHRSPYRGLSIEFAQHRQYAPGDDVRHLDWKVFARSDKLYLKEYQKETNLDLVVLVDASGSMGYTSAANGLWCKYDLAASLAAALSFMAIKQQDRVSVVLFADQLLTQTRLSSARDHWRSILGTLEVQSGQLIPEATGDGAASARSTDLARLFDQVVARLAQRSLLVLISDLFDDVASMERGMARLFHQRHDLIIFQTLDRAELEFPFRDPSVFEDLETESRLNLDPPALRQAYLKALGAHREQIEQLARRFSFDHLLLNTSDPLGPPLSKFLATRAGAVARGAGGS